MLNPKLSVLETTHKLSQDFSKCHHPSFQASCEKPFWRVIYY